MKGEPLVIPAERSHSDGEVNIPDLLRDVRFDTLEKTRAGLARGPAGALLGCIAGTGRLA